MSDSFTKQRAIESIRSNIAKLYDLHIQTCYKFKSLEKFSHDLLLSIKRSASKHLKPIFLFNEFNQIIGFCVCCFDPNIQFTGSKSAFFFNLMLLNETKTADSMREAMVVFMTVVNVSKIIGPIHESIIFERGLRLLDVSDGFTGLPNNKSYINHILHKAKFHKEHDLIEVIFKNTDQASKIVNLHKLLKKKFNTIELKIIDGKGIYDRANEITNFYNNEWNKNWGFLPILEEDIKTFCDSIPCHLNNAIFAYKENELVGFCMMLEEYQKTSRVYFIGTGSTFRKSGLSVYLLTTGMEIVNKKQINLISCSWMLESNLAATSLVKKFLPLGSTEERRYRIYNFEQ